MHCQLVPLFLAGLLSADPEAAVVWPQFRGPGGQGHVDVTGLPVQWGEKTNVRWKVPIPGLGWSSPVIGNGQVWMTTALADGHSLRAVCVDAEGGKLLHDVEVFHIEKPPGINRKNSYATPTPVLEPGRLYVHFGTMGTACLDTATGKVLWRNDTLKLDHKEGPGSSPVVWKDLLILTCDGMDVQYMAALRKHDGSLAWKAKRTGIRATNPDFRKAYCTPLVVTVDGQEQLLSVGADRTSAYDPATGKELWWVNYNGFSNVPRPVVGHGMMYFATGYMRPELWAVRLGGTGDRTRDGVVWKETKNVPNNPSPLLVGDVLYTVSDRGILVARDARTGKELYNERLGWSVCSSPWIADGRIYVSDEKGRTTVFKPGPTFQMLARNELDGRIQATPAVADGAIFLRTETHLYRIEETAR